MSADQVVTCVFVPLRCRVTSPLVYTIPISDLKMRSVTVVALIATLAFFTAPVAAESLGDILKNLDVFTIRTSSWTCLASPFRSCPDHSAFIYYSCCGSPKIILPDKCCFHFQDWFLVTFALLFVLIVAWIIVKLLRCLCCCAILVLAIFDDFEDFELV
uniref:Uncharacterized protein n=1 Tax=Steinernema glaseri TaxID=37863 RepID=A0A1I7Y2E9_9BILA